MVTGLIFNCIFDYTVVICPIIPDQYKCLSDGSQYLLHDSGVYDDERFIIIGSMTGLRTLSMSTQWHADGTFKTTPLIFKQLYSILA